MRIWHCLRAVCAVSWKDLYFRWLLSFSLRLSPSIYSLPYAFDWWYQQPQQSASASFLIGRLCAILFTHHLKIMCFSCRRVAILDINLQPFVAIQIENIFVTEKIYFDSIGNNAYCAVSLRPLSQKPRKCTVNSWMLCPWARERSSEGGRENNGKSNSERGEHFRNIVFTLKICVPKTNGKWSVKVQFMVICFGFCIRSYTLSLSPCVWCINWCAWAQVASRRPRQWDVQCGSENRANDWSNVLTTTNCARCYAPSTSQKSSV